MQCKFFIIPSVVLFSGCLVGPSYNRPEIDIKPEYRSAIHAIEHNKKVDSHTWWKFFNDPVLDKLVAEGTGANLDIQTALARVNEARAIAGEGRLGLFPEATLNGDYTEGKFGTATNPFFRDVNRDFRAYRGSLAFDWELDLFGRVRRIIEQREANQGALEEALAGVLVSVQADIVDTYLLLRSAEVEKKVLRKNAKKQKESVSITNDLYEAGAASELDVARARSQYHSTQSELPLVEARIQAQLNRLAVLLGRSPADLPGYLRGEVRIPRYTGPVNIAAPAELLQRRPDVREAERKLAAATAEIGIETAEFFPRVTILGTVGYEARDFSALGDTNSDFYSVGPSISWRILNMRRIMRRIDAADERTNQALASYQQTALRALEDVENALTEFKTLRLRLARIDQATAESQKAADISREQYQAGSLDFLNVLAAESTRLELEQVQVVSKAEVQRSYVRLFRAFGGGWNFGDAVEEVEEKPSVPSDT